MLLAQGPQAHRAGPQLRRLRAIQADQCPLGPVELLLRRWGWHPAGTRRGSRELHRHLIWGRQHEDEHLGPCQPWGTCTWVRGW